MSESQRVIERIAKFVFLCYLNWFKIIDFKHLFNEEKYFIKGDPFDGAQGFGVNSAERPAY